MRGAPSFNCGSIRKLNTKAQRLEVTFFSLGVLVALCLGVKKKYFSDRLYGSGVFVGGGTVGVIVGVGVTGRRRKVCADVSNSSMRTNNSL